MYRLSYNVNDSNEIVSNLVQHLDCVFFVLINPKDKTFSVIKLNDEGHEIVHKESYITTEVAKRKARSVLLSCGVVLES